MAEDPPINAEVDKNFLQPVFIGAILILPIVKFKIN
jgi:hypothetical protein